MNEAYIRMNTDYFESRTDYLSMFTSPDFNKIQKGAEDLPYANFQVTGEKYYNEVVQLACLDFAL